VPGAQVRASQLQPAELVGAFLASTTTAPPAQFLLKPLLSVPGAAI